LEETMKWVRAGIKKEKWRAVIYDDRNAGRLLLYPKLASGGEIEE
jgi:hypothetical protein